MKPNVVSQALLGPVENATVKLQSIGNAGQLAAQCSMTTTASENLEEAGKIQIPDNCLGQSELYVLSVSGGQDVDADDNGLRDASPTPVQGVFHSLLSEQELRSGQTKVSALTESAWQQVRYLIHANYHAGAIQRALDDAARLLIRKDLDGDNNINRIDLLRWHPRRDKDALRVSAKDLSALTASIHSGVDTEKYALAILSPRTKEQARLSLSSQITHMIARDGYVFASLGDQGVAVIDVRNASKPNLVAQKSTASQGYVNALTLSGHYLFAPEASTVFDIATPSAMVQGAFPTELNDPNTWAPAADTSLLVGNHLIVSSRHIFYDGPFHDDCCWRGLQIYDVRDPLHPSHKRFIPPAEGRVHIKSMVYQDAKLYLGAENIVVMDVSNPESPVELGGFTVRAQRSFPILAVHGNVVLAGRDYQHPGDEDDLAILDYSVTSQPKVKKFLQIPGEIQRIVVHEKRAYVLSSAGITVVELDNTENIRVLGTFELTAGASNLVFVGDNAIAASGSDIVVLDLREPRPLIDSSGILYSHQFEDDIGGLVYAGDHLWVTTLSGVLSLRPELAPWTLVSSVPTSGALSPVATATRLYLPSLFAGLSIVDITNPVVPMRLDATPAIAYPTALALSGNYAYVTELATSRNGRTKHGLHVVDVANDRGTILASFDVNGYPRALTSTGSHIYLTNWDVTYPRNALPAERYNASLVAYDISTPANPVLRTTVQIPNGSGNFIATGGVGYLAAAEYGVLLFDLSKPDEPKPLGQINMAGKVSQVIVDGNTLYIAAGYSGLHALDIRTPRTPQFVGTVESSEPVRTMAIAGDYLIIGTDGRRAQMVKRIVL